MNQNTYIINRSESTDPVMINKLASSFNGKDEFSLEYLMRGLRSHMNICTLEARYDGALVGIVTVWKTKIHPYCMYFAMVTDHSHPLTVEELLLDHLVNYTASQTGLNYPLQTSIWETSHRLKRLYDKQGFIEIRRTYNPTLPLSSSAIQPILLHKLHNTSYFNENSRIVRIQDLIDHEQLKAQLIMLIRDTYAKTHIQNPLGIYDLAYWEQIVFDESIKFEASFVVVDDHDIQAFALLHESDSPNRLEFGWRGTKEINDIYLIQQLTALQIQFAKEQGYDYMDGEIDTTDLFALEMMNNFPFEPASALITYQINE